MDAEGTVHRASAVICREITGADHDEVAGLLTEGFAAWRRRPFWDAALTRLGARSVPAGLPRFGYVLEAEGRIVGVLLLICAEVEGVVRCNVSSWYVEPAHRAFGSLLVHKALRLRDAVVMNVTPAPPTWPVLAAQGYRRFARGRAVFVPALARGGGGARVWRVREEVPAGRLPEGEARLLLEHAAWRCVSLVAERGGEAAPFVFGRRARRGVPFGYLLYCRSLESVVAHARSLGMALLRAGMVAAVTDADGRLPGVPGWFEDGLPKFYRGKVAPRLGDLAYTERAVFGA